MKNINMRVFNFSISLWVLAAILLTGCGNRFEDQMNQAHKEAQTNLDYLKTQLDNKQLANALLIDEYAKALINLKPQYANIATLMKKEATSNGQAYTGLIKRLSAVDLVPTSTEQAAYGLQEILYINTAADSHEFNNSLVDVVNTIASLSDGELKVINVPYSKVETAQKANSLIGNPSYGQWQQGSDGRSFWEWYGMYSMFTNVFGGRPYYYDSWSSRPHYSYYNQYGRDRWGSSSDVSRNYNLSNRHPSKYNKPSSTTKARYAKASQRSSSYGGSSSKTSNGKSSSRYSSYGSSSRSSSFSSSRSFRSGK